MHAHTHIHTYVHTHTPNIFFLQPKRSPHTFSGLALCMEATGLDYYASLIIDFLTSILVSYNPLSKEKLN